MTTKSIVKKNHNNSLRNDAFNDFLKPWNGWFSDDLWQATPTVPAVNISEDDKKYKLFVAAPGLKKEDFRIDVAGNFLTISAEKEESTEEKEKEYSRKEYNYSSFSRSFSLPEEIKQENIEAEYKDGQLTITLPKNDAVIKKSKSVKVK